MEKLLTQNLTGLPLGNLPLRTRAKKVKQEICKALGYPIPFSFKKTQPRFPGQNFDVYTQKSTNIQIWNQDIDIERRYVLIRIDARDIICKIKIITGKTLLQYDHTGKLTSKFQATIPHLHTNRLLSPDSPTLRNHLSQPDLSKTRPNALPIMGQILSIKEIYQRLLSLVGKHINYINATQERNRGAALHKLVCHHLGYSTYEDDGTYPDILNQLLEIKLQTSPTIDLGLHSPENHDLITTVNAVKIYSQDIRYAIFCGEIIDEYIFLDKLYMVAGKYFSQYFPIWKNRNTKIQLPLPSNFWD